MTLKEMQKVFISSYRNYSLYKHILFTCYLIIPYLGNHPDHDMKRNVGNKVVFSAGKTFGDTVLKYHVEYLYVQSKITCIFVSEDI